MTGQFHFTDIYPIKLHGARRYEARCRTCDWRSNEPRRELSDAEDDGALHEATSDPRQTSIEDVA